MLRWTSAVLFAVVFLGCSRDTAFEYFTKLDSTAERAVVNLRQIVLRDDRNNTRALISVIYLDPVQPQIFRRQHFFLVGLYDSRKRPLFDYNLTLNGEAPKGIVELDDNCSLRRLMPLNNPWTDYYEVVFAHTDDENLTLTFENGPSLKGSAVYRSVR